MKRLLGESPRDRRSFLDDNSDETLVVIQRWFADQCDGEWEHSHGITIGTVDNPGWSIEIDLDETSLSDRELKRHELHCTTNDWLVCWREATKYRAACGPPNLEAPLRHFLRWATAESH